MGEGVAEEGLFSQKQEAADKTCGGSEEGDAKNHQTCVVLFEAKSFAKEFPGHGSFVLRASDVLESLGDIVEQVEFAAVGFLEILPREGFTGGAAGNDAHVEQDQIVEVS